MSSASAPLRFLLHTGRIVSVLAAVLLGCVRMSAQSIPAGIKTADIEVGGGYGRTAPDYSPRQFNGFKIFGDYDFLKYAGVEASFNHAAGSTPSISENTFEAGVRARFPYREFRPYVRIMAGLGSFSGGQKTQDGTYGLYAAGAGLEYWLPRKFTVRADYEYQRWGNFPPRGLQPNITSIGVAYRIR